MALFVDDLNAITITRISLLACYSLKVCIESYMLCPYRLYTKEAVPRGAMQFIQKIQALYKNLVKPSVHCKRNRLMSKQCTRLFWIYLGQVTTGQRTTCEQIWVNGFHEIQKLV